MPELAALERVAKEKLEDILGRVNFLTYADQVRAYESVAAALAACAREARLAEARWWAQHQSDLAEVERIEALERAVGEKA